MRKRILVIEQTYEELMYVCVNGHWFEVCEDIMTYDEPYDYDWTSPSYESWTIEAIPMSQKLVPSQNKELTATWYIYHGPEVSEENFPRLVVELIYCEYCHIDGKITVYDDGVHPTNYFNQGKLRNWR